MSNIDMYIEVADSWGEAMNEGDSDKANELHDKIQEIFKDICQNGNENALFERIDKVSNSTLFFIASHIKERDQDKAIPIYESLMKSSEPFIAISAKYILKEIRGA